MHLAGTGNQRGSANGTSPLLPTGIQHHPGNRELIPFSGKTGKTKTSTDSPQTLPQFPNTFQKPHSSTGEPFQTFRKHSVPVARRHGQHPIRTSTACPMRQTKRSPPTIPDENNVDPFGENKTVPDAPKCGGAYVSVQAHPVADLHFRKQAGPCSLMSWKIPSRASHDRWQSVLSNRTYAFVFASTRDPCSYSVSLNGAANADGPCSRIRRPWTKPSIHHR